MDAIQHMNDSLKADVGELRDKLRNQQSFSETREKYIAQLELRFSHLCDPCKAKIPETAFTPSLQQYALKKITIMLEEQKKTISSLESKLELGALRAPDRDDKKDLSYSRETPEHNL